MRPAVLLSPLVIAACVAGVASPDSGGITPPPPAGTCGAPALQGLIGQSETVLQAMTFAVPVRIIHPGTAVTMDYREDRLNIEIDAEGKISHIRCG